MKKPFTLSAVIFVIFLVSSAMGQNREDRQVGPFEAFSVGSGIDAFYYQSDEFKVVVQSNSDLDDIETYVDNGELKIKYENSFFNFKWNSRDKVYIYAPTIKGIRASGGSDVKTEDVLHSEVLVLRASGGSDLKLDVDVEEIDVSCSGGSDAFLAGKATLFIGHASGGSDIKAYDLSCEEADVEASGGSDIHITVHKEIHGNASGGSDIYYKGNPERVYVDSSSGGDIHRNQ